MFYNGSQQQTLINRRKNMTAHIFKAKGGIWTLIISRSPIGQINGDNVISQAAYENKTAAKQAAKAIGAKPWNYL